METLSLGGLPLDEQLRRLANLPADSVVIFVYYRADSLGRSMVAADVLELVTRASAAPVYAASETWLGRGIVGGDMERPAHRALSGSPRLTAARSCAARLRRRSRRSRNRRGS